jgi:hypothetical protein
MCLRKTDRQSACLEYRPSDAALNQRHSVACRLEATYRGRAWEDVRPLDPIGSPLAIPQSPLCLTAARGRRATGESARALARLAGADRALDVLSWRTAARGSQTRRHPRQGARRSARCGDDGPPGGGRASHLAHKRPRQGNFAFVPAARVSPSRLCPKHSGPFSENFVCIFFPLADPL